ncbi:DNA repair ATPase [Pseudomonas sp. R4-39-08]|uniref:TrlF family AAA-like ATPase n=1 Tax=Pseudomonas sp. R4-39-08 TaxID=1173288 RepID=UPI000F57EBC2|nr:hypothetical protein [Pseudomonas sp. R4-39-08]AZF35127.1 DNA repair ATPase [Pseudomonas sp. R4-39-08]
MTAYPRGSEWRKWDLHVHTPASVLQSEFGKDWDGYVVTLFRRAIEENISVIGITDYYLPEGYEILRRDYLENSEKLKELFDEEAISAIKEIKVFPNIEFRLSKLVIGKERDLSWNRKVNYHVVLSDELAIEKINSDFISQIQFCFNASAGAELERRPLTKSNLEDLGRRLIAEHPEFDKYGNALFVGMMNASVDENELIKLLRNNTIFRDRHLVALPCDEDLSIVNWNSQGHMLRKSLIKQAHFIFSSNPNTAAFFLGGKDKVGFVREFGAVKACLWGSDAHCEGKLFKPDNNRHTWIKSDPTFEGLKQVIYDPSSRVVVQELSPQQKSSYQTIDRVRFVNKAGVGSFSESWIVLNPDLNTIIGGKSSGKSLLLYHIARSVNRDEVDSKVRLSKSSTYSGIELGDFEVLWSNGDISKLSDLEGKKPLTYIPQLYINHLAEEDGKEQLNSLVKDILLQSKGFREFSEFQEGVIISLGKEINSKVDYYFELRDKFKVLSKQSEEFGVKAAVVLEIDRLRQEIKSLREKSGFTEVEENWYKFLASRKATLEKRELVIGKIESAADKMVNISSTLLGSLINDFKEGLTSEVGLPYDSTYLANSLKLLEKKVGDAVVEFGLEIMARFNSIESSKARIALEYIDIDKKLQPLLIKITDQELLNLTIKKLNDEEVKLKFLNEILERQVSIKALGLECLEELAGLYSGRVCAYRDYAAEIDKPEYQFESGLDVSAVVEFNEDKFNEFLFSFDRRGSLEALLSGLLAPDGSFNFNLDSHAERVENIRAKIIKKHGVPLVRKGVEDIDLLKKLYSDCFYISYVVRYRDDDIATMSPGKRGLVLLNLILHLSNSSHPILIDQPEDNLDNRTIYDQLKDFVRQKKSSRQIIMVTHNANLVVAADAECVVVANQDGQQLNVDIDLPRFDYFSGGLECSFERTSDDGTLRNQGIRQHVCEILEGGVTAFKEREMKYGLKI